MDEKRGECGSLAVQLKEIERKLQQAEEKVQETEAKVYTAGKREFSKSRGEGAAGEV